MQLLKLYIENFMGNRKSELDFTAFSSCLIVGVNKHNDRESNGTGKSTIFKAIDFVLFGKYSAAHIDEIIREGADKCTVSLEFKSGDSIYRVTRIRHSKTELKLEEKAGDKWIPKGQRTSKQAAKELEKLIRINYEAFRGSILFAQGDLSGLAAATPDKRKALLKEPLQLAVYSKFEEIAKKKNKKLEEDLQLINTQLDVLGNPQEIINDYSKRIEQINKDVEKCKEITNTAKNEVNTYKTQLNDISKKLEGASDSLGKMAVINTKRANQHSYIVKFTNSIKENTSKKEIKLTTASTLKTTLKTLKKDLKGLKDKKLRTEAEVEDKIKELQEAEQKGVTLLAQLQAQLDTCEHVLPGTETCSQCKQIITDKYRNKFIKDNTSLKAQLNKDYALYHGKLIKLREDKTKLRTELKEITNIKSKIVSVESEIQVAETKINSIKEVIEQLDKALETANTGITDCKQEIKNLDEEINKLTAELNKTNVPELQKKESELINQVSAAEKLLNHAFSQLSDKNRELGNAESIIDRAREDLRKIERHKKNKSSLEKQLKIRKRGVFAFSPKGIPTLVIHTILDDLQLEANNLLQELRPELGLRFVTEKEDKDTLDMIFTVNGSARDYNLLSGGQKMYLALSIKMGLSLLIQKKLDVSIKFLELDEVDQPLDKAGVEAFADVIRCWQNKFKIFVITHNEDLKDKFSHAILVEKDQDGATAKVVTQW